MTEPEKAVAATDEELLTRVRPLVDDILDRFNRDHISPSEAGMVILSLIHSLMSALEKAPEARRFFIRMMINVINNHLAEEAGGETAAAGAAKN